MPACDAKPDIRSLLGVPSEIVTVPAASSEETVNGPGPRTRGNRNAPVFGSNRRLKEFATTVGVTGVPSLQVASLRSVKVAEVALAVHDFARYGTILPSLSRLTRRSYSENPIWLPFVSEAPCV